jgi:hypothetical protein
LREWARERGIDWFSLYNPSFTIGTVSNTDTYPIPSTVRKFSQRQGDRVRILHTNGLNYTDYDLVEPNDLQPYYSGQNKEYPYGNYASVIGSNLVFNYKFATTSPMYGGTIKAPVYVFPTALVNGTDTVVIDDPDWLITASAAEYVRNDLTRQNQYPNLVAEANELMERMKEDNESQVEEIYRVNPLTRMRSTFAEDW